MSDDKYTVIFKVARISEKTPLKPTALFLFK